MGTVNIHNRDRFYVAGDSRMFSTNRTPWGEFPAPFPRGPTSVDAMHPILFQGNVLESERRFGKFGEPGAWWGVQCELSCLDLDDGGTRWDITENVCIANGTAGLKMGHDVDHISFTNNIVIVTPPLWAQRGLPGWQSTDVVPADGQGQQPKDNSNVYSGNVHVRLQENQSTDAWPSWGRGNSSAWYVTFRLNFHHFDRFELDLRGRTLVRGAAFSWPRLKSADVVLI